MRSYTVSSFDGYKIHCQYIPSEKESARYVILSHGYTYSLLGSVKYMHLFRAYGMNCILYDNRAHGKNRFGKCTFGLRESKDLLAVIDDLHARFGESIVLGLHGESMGSGIGLSVLQYKPTLDFIVNDCGYGVLSDVLEYKLKQIFHLPKGFLKLLDFFAKILFGFSFYSIRPVDFLSENQIPICFIHGDNDHFIDCAQSKAMHKATGGYSELHLFRHAEHAGSFAADEKKYKKILFAFLDHVLESREAHDG